MFLHAHVCIQHSVIIFKLNFLYTTTNAYMHMRRNRIIGITKFYIKLIHFM